MRKTFLPHHGSGCAYRPVAVTLVALKNISCINLLLHIIQHSIIAVGNDSMALSLELDKVINHLAAKEQAAVFKGRLVDNDLGTFGFDAFHNALDGTLTEVIGVALHCEAEDANSRCLKAGIVLGVYIILSVVVITSHLEYLVGNEVLTGAVALYNGAHHVLRNICIVGQELLGVLGQAITTIAKAGVIVEGTNTGVKAYTLNDGLGVKAFYFCIGIQFVEVADTESQVSVGKEFYGFCLFHAHEEHINVLFDGSFLQQGGKLAGFLFHLGHIGYLQDSIILFLEIRAVNNLGATHNDTGRIEVVVEGLALTEEFR